MDGVLKNLIHPVIRVMMKITATIYFEKVIVKGKENIPADGPCILACNHPNSFLDALIITVYYEHPIFYLARGDAFKKPLGAKLLRFLNNIPMYRKEEGTENISKNRESFEYCLDVLKKGDSVLIFSEGICENEWYLRPFRKGTARLVYEASRDNDLKAKLKVIPVATNYSGWFGAGNKMYIEFLPALTINELYDDQGLFLKKFNAQLRNSLIPKCVSIDKDSDIKLQNALTGFILKNLPNGIENAINFLDNFRQAAQAHYHEKCQDFATFTRDNKMRYYCEKGVSVFAFLVSLLIVPLAILLNFIPYSICKYIAEKTTHRSVFYDSVFFGSLLIIGTIYMVLLASISVCISHSPAGLIPPIIAFFCAAFFEKALRNICCFLNPRRQSLSKSMLMDIC